MTQGSRPVRTGLRRLSDTGQLGKRILGRAESAPYNRLIALKGAGLVKG
jgi:hypothetical protein